MRNLLLALLLVPAARGAQFLPLQTASGRSTPGICVQGLGAKSVVCSGENVSAAGHWADAIGGLNNSAPGDECFVGAGDANISSGTANVIAGGRSNTTSIAAVFSVISGGFNNTNHGTNAVIPGGVNNFVDGDRSFAAGNGAYAPSASAFVWNSSNTTASQFLYLDHGPETFNIHAEGGVFITSASLTVDKFVTASTFNAVGSAYQMHGLTFLDTGANLFASSGTFGSDILGASSVTASAFFGDGSHLTGISAGSCSTGAGTSSVLCQGSGNTSAGNFSTVGGGQNCQAVSDYDTVAGGQGNSAAGSYSFVGGGNGNSAPGAISTIGGGNGNSAGGLEATVGGGNSNSAQGLHDTISGGSQNSIGSTRTDSTIGGGRGNSISGNFNVIAGGQSNNAAGSDHETISGGMSNATNGQYSVITGGLNNESDGLGSTADGGEDNLAAGDHSFAAGFNTRAMTPGSFVWLSDDGGPQILYHDHGVGTVNFRSNPGIYFDTVSSVTITSGTLYVPASSVTASAFFGDASHETGFAILTSSEGANTVLATNFIGVTTNTVTLRGGRPTRITAETNIDNASVGNRTYACDVTQNSVLIGKQRSIILATLTKGLMLQEDVITSPAGVTTFSLLCNTSNAVGTQTATKPEIIVVEY